MWHETNPSLEEKIASLFQPDSLLPVQYLENFKRKTYLEPEHRLMMAVLEDGISCFQRYISARGRKGQTLFREAEEWIFSQTENDWLFSFENVCEVLGVDPNYIRYGLTQWKKETLTRPLKAKHQLAYQTPKKIHRKKIKAAA